MKIFFFQEPSNDNNNDNNNTEGVYRNMNVVFISAYVTEPQAKLIKEILSFSEFPKSCAPYQCDDRVIQTTEDYSRKLMDLMDHFGWRNIKMLRVVNQNTSPYQRYFSNVIKMMNETQRFCLQAKTLNLSHFQNHYGVDHELFTQQVEPFLGNEQSVFIVFGETYETSQMIEFFNLTGVMIVHDHYMNQFSHMQDHMSLSGRITVVDKRRSEFVETQEYDNNFFFDWTIPLYRLGFELQNFFISDHVNHAKVLQGVHKEFMNEMENYILPLDTRIADLPLNRPMSKEQATSLTRKFLNEEPKRYPSIQCNKEYCPPGYEETYGKIAIFKENTDMNSTRSIEKDDEMSFGMRCTRCAVNHIKLGFGDGPCAPCTGTLSIDDGYRTQCIDPYSNHDLEIDQTLVAISFVLGIVGCLIGTIVITILIINRDTPTVRSSDFRISLLHLVAITMTFACGLLASFSGKLSLEKCVFRNMNVSIFYCIDVACVYTKSEKIMVAFISQVRISPGRVRKTIAMQIFTIFILLVSVNSLLAVLYSGREPQIEFRLDSIKMHRINFCNTAYHQQYLILNFTVLQLACSVQAFRGRNLPGPMNDAMALVYSILIATATFTVSFPISYFRGQKDAESIQLIAIFINTICFLLLLYGTKCFVILFRPEKNTKIYFSQQRMAAMAVQTGYVITTL